LGILRFPLGYFFTGPGVGISIISKIHVRCRLKASIQRRIFDSHKVNYGEEALGQMPDKPTRLLQNQPKNAAQADENDEESVRQGKSLSAARCWMMQRAADW
jgi:hypothetical protein